jgi:hypothetical protein
MHERCAHGLALFTRFGRQIKKKRYVLLSFFLFCQEFLVVTTTDEIPSDNDEIGGFGSTANTKSLDRGLAGALSLLRATGDVTGKNAGKEDLCGWAKDERMNEDYERLNLKEVVNIDTKFVTVKDLEFANREIKLD